MTATVFVHVQGPHARQLEETWGGTAEAVEGAKGLFVLGLEVLQAVEVGDDARAAKVIDALKKAFGALEVAEVSKGEYELLSGDEVVNATMRPQGLVLTTKDGLLAAAAWAPTVEETVKVAASTLTLAKQLRP